jgi:hypothetical protein
MQEKQLFEYAVIRIVPLVEREEFINVGVVLYCPKQKFLKVMFELDEQRIKAFSPNTDIEEIRKYLCAFEAICNAGTNSGSIGKLPMAERFRWLTAMRSTIVQTSRVHPGLCMDAAQMLTQLYVQLVIPLDK